MYLVHSFLRLELAPIQILHNVLVLDLERLDASLSLFKLDLLLVSCLADFAVAVIVEALLLQLLFRARPAFFKHLLAVLKYFVLPDDLAVFVALELRERVCILSFIRSPLQLAHKLVSFRGLSANQFLLLQDNLL